jgi:predicted kinase
MKKESNMKELFLLRGLPGSGKSTLAKSIGGIHIEADQYFMEDGVYNFDASKLKNAHNYCQAQTQAWMKTDGEQVNVDRLVVSNTFTMEWEMKPYYELAEKYGYRVYSLIVENRHGESESSNIHNVPKEKIDDMRKRFNFKL